MFISCSDSEIMQLKIVLLIWLAICVVGLSLGENWERRDQDRRDCHPDGFGCIYGDRCCNGILFIILILLCYYFSDIKYSKCSNTNASTVMSSPNAITVMKIVITS